MLYRCPTCRGEYQDPLPDGSRYFHACAPVANPAYNLDPNAGPVDPRPTLERPAKRDENPVFTAATDEEGRLVPVRNSNEDVVKARVAVVAAAPEPAAPEVPNVEA
jgi:hypothetical protein